MQRALAARPARAAQGAAGARRAAVAVVLRGPAGGPAEALFMRRAEHPQDPWSGQIGFPGGRAEPGDADLLATAVREAEEEVGLDLRAAAQFVGSLDEVRAMARLRPVDLVIQPFVFRLLHAVDARPGEEAASVHWLALGDLLDPQARGLLDYRHGDTILQFPCLRPQPDVVIWGLTLRMLTSLVDRLEEAGS